MICPPGNRTWVEPKRSGTPDRKRSLFLQQGKALTNFARTLPAPQSDLAQELIKDPYSFDFLALGPAMSERELEQSLLEHLRSLIFELGKGFAFGGSQHHLEVRGARLLPRSFILSPSAALLRRGRAHDRGT
jgi:hypothetical protein